MIQVLDDVKAKLIAMRAVSVLSGLSPKTAKYTHTKKLRCFNRYYSMLSRTAGNNGDGVVAHRLLFVLQPLSQSLLASVSPSAERSVAVRVLSVRLRAKMAKVANQMRKFDEYLASNAVNPGRRLTLSTEQEQEAISAYKQLLKPQA